MSGNIKSEISNLWKRHVELYVNCEECKEAQTKIEKPIKI